MKEGEEKKKKKKQGKKKRASKWKKKDQNLTFISLLSKSLSIYSVININQIS